MLTQRQLNDQECSGGWECSPGVESLPSMQKVLNLILSTGRDSPEERVRLPVKEEGRYPAKLHRGENVLRKRLTTWLPSIPPTAVSSQGLGWCPSPPFLNKLLMGKLTHKTT